MLRVGGWGLGVGGWELYLVVIVERFWWSEVNDESHVELAG
jgi:hypothetical protein